ncbi:MFS transporter [Armatimonas rosea]|uniref:Sugar phosphate permease n=1 Tax=Armatimonas rosea TaxID=685828 RepID=A0A7W9SR53_ARMRO|nr:MFS transporter [Armatimonas rosea]MBB6051277.1 sugar phosphate permease [Armatimonas rosea]
MRRPPSSPATALLLLTLGYAGYYFCRASFSVAKPQLIEFLVAGGTMDKAAAKIALGGVASAATLAYACGKFASGALADFWSGRRNFLMGMIGAIVFSLMFAFSGTLPLFTLAWVLNRLIQALGWPGALKVTGSWYPASSYGTAVGVLSLSYLFGDFAARQFHGALINNGVGWQGLFIGGAIVLAVLLVLNALFLRENSTTTPTEAGESTAPDETPEPDAKAFLRSPSFWCVCIISLAFTLARETFNEWTPTYLVEFGKLSKGTAATQSSFFPLFGGFAVILAGKLSDGLGRSGRAFILLLSLPVIALLLSTLALLPAGSPLLIFAISATGFFLIGPYSFLAGALSLDFGGKKAGATASGIIDGIGYLGGVLAGESMARLSVALGWKGAFFTLGGVLLVSLIPAAYFWKEQKKRDV